MNILQVTPGYSPEIGGVQRHVQEVSEALARLGHRVVVATTCKDNRLPRREEIGLVEVRRFMTVGRGIYQLPIGLLEHLRQVRNEFDVIHAHNSHALPLLIALLNGRERTVITPHFHGHGHSRLANLIHLAYDPITVPLLRRAARIVCVSAGEADLIALHWHVARTHVDVVPNIIPLPPDSAERLAQSNLRLNAASPLLLSVGRLEPYKRVDRIIAAMPYLPADYRLVIVGVGSDSQRLAQQVAALKLQQRVQFAGRLSDTALDELYRTADVVVSLSEAEAFGRIVVEALMYGCRMVCSDIPSFKELADQFAQAVTTIPAAWPASKIAEAVLAAVARPMPESLNLQRFSWQEVAGALLHIYQDLPSQHSIVGGLPVT